MKVLRVLVSRPLQPLKLTEIAVLAHLPKGTVFRRLHHPRNGLIAQGTVVQVVSKGVVDAKVDRSDGLGGYVRFTPRRRKATIDLPLGLGRYFLSKIDEEEKRYVESGPLGIPPKWEGPGDRRTGVSRSNKALWKRWVDELMKAQYPSGKFYTLKLSQS